VPQQLLLYSADNILLPLLSAIQRFPASSAPAVYALLQQEKVLMQLQPLGSRGAQQMIEVCLELYVLWTADIVHARSSWSRFVPKCQLLTRSCHLRM
jgi:hypothetical protein